MLKSTVLVAMFSPVTTLAVWGVDLVISTMIKSKIKELIKGRKGKKPSGEESREAVDEELEHLCWTMQLIDEVLQSTQENQEDHNSALRTWLHELRLVLYDVEDVVDDHVTDAAVRDLQSGSLKGNKEWWAEVTKNIKAANKRLDLLMKSRRNLGLQLFDKSEKSSSHSWQWRESTSIVENTFQLEGREDVKKEIIKILLKQLDRETEKFFPGNIKNKNSSLVFLPIVGMGGVGKTALAQAIFNDDTVCSSFNMRVWICVSNNFVVHNLLKRIIESIYFLQGKEKECMWISLEQLHNELLKLVEGNRILLILDDVWNDETSLWESLLRPLRVTRSGCHCVMVTSRFKKINFSVNGSMEPIVLSSLGDEHLWRVFQRNVFGEENNLHWSNYNNQLQHIGKKIANRMKGSPLAAISVGRLLGRNYDLEHWAEILNSQLWQLKMDNGGIFSSLMLSYKQLPPYLKQCVTYFSLYPKSYEFDEMEMIQLWMSQECIQYEKEEEIEDVGKGYLRDLADRSIVQFDVKGGRTRYFIHDLVHDLLQSISSSDFYLSIDDTKKEVPFEIHHAAFFANRGQYYFMHKMFNNISKYRKLRTLILDNIANSSCQTEIQLIDDTIVESVLDNMRFLRALVLRRYLIKVLPQSIRNLKHLRHLDLSYSYIDKLPESLACLHNLQILNLDRCQGLKYLPNSITRLVNLRHLVTSHELISSIKGIGRLSMLQELNSFSVGKDNGYHITELKELNMLQRRLEIKNICLIKCKKDAQQAKLDKKRQLKHIELSWFEERETFSSRVRRRYYNKSLTSRMLETHQKISKIPSIAHDKMLRQVHDDVLEALKPHNNIKSICVEGYIGVLPPSWLNGSYFLLLQEVKIVGCTHMETLPPCLGKMSHLRSLCLYDMPNLKEISWNTTIVNDIENGTSPCLADLYKCNILFPSLEEMVFVNLPEWIIWQPWHVQRAEEKKTSTISISSTHNIVHVLPQLQELTIEECPVISLKFFEITTKEFLFPVEWEKCDNKFSILDSFCKGNHQFTDLNKLFKGHVQLQHHTPSSKDALVLCSKSLRKLTIAGCPKLVSLMLPMEMTSLRELTIEDCPMLMSLSLSKSLTILEVFNIRFCHHIMSVDLSPNMQIDRMGICRCRDLAYFGSFGASPCTSTLSFSMPMFLPIPSTSNSMETTMSTQHFPIKVTNLHISYCSKKQINLLLYQIIASHLQKLKITSCFDLENFCGEDDSNGVQIESSFLNLTSLSTLEIRACRELKSLPSNISSHLLNLECIKLFDCPLLASLPNLQSLTSLRELRVFCCPKITNNYKEKRNDGGIVTNHVWGSLSQIPKVEFIDE